MTNEFTLMARLRINHMAPTITVDTSALAQPTAGVAYSGTVYATTTGGALTITADSLPAGLTLGATTFASGKYQATVSGTPTAAGGPLTTFTASDGTNSAAGTYQWNVQASAGGGVSVIRAAGGLTNYGIAINAPLAFAVPNVQEGDIVVVCVNPNSSGMPTFTATDDKGNAWTTYTNYDRSGCKVVATCCKANASGTINMSIAVSVATNTSPIAYIVRGATSIDAAKIVKTSRATTSTGNPLTIGPFGTSGRSVLLFFGNNSQGTSGDCSLLIDAGAGFTEDIEGYTAGNFYATNAWKIESTAAVNESFNVQSRNVGAGQTSLISTLLIPVLY